MGDIDIFVHDYCKAKISQSSQVLKTVYKCVKLSTNVSNVTKNLSYMPIIMILHDYYFSWLLRPNLYSSKNIPGQSLNLVIQKSCPNIMDTCKHNSYSKQLLCICCTPVQYLSVTRPSIFESTKVQAFQSVYLKLLWYKYSCNRNYTYMVVTQSWGYEHW